MLKRSCAGRYWRRRFPSVSKSDIREFLQIFVDGFALPKKHYLAFRPDDRIMDIYRAVNPKWISVDSMEFEIFGQLLQRRYGLTLESFWNEDLTLGEVFSRTRSA